MIRGVGSARGNQGDVAIGVPGDARQVRRSRDSGLGQDDVVSEASVIGDREVNAIVGRNGGPFRKTSEGTRARI